MAYYPYAAFSTPDPVKAAVDPIVGAFNNIINYKLTQQADELQYQRIMEERDRLDKIRVEGDELAAQHRLEDLEREEALQDEGRALRLMGELPSGQLTEEQYNIISPHSKRAFLQEERSMIPGAEITPTYWLGKTAAEVQQDIENRYRRSQAEMSADQFAQDMALRGRSLTAQTAATAESVAARLQRQKIEDQRYDIGQLQSSTSNYARAIQTNVNQFYTLRASLTPSMPDPDRLAVEAGITDVSVALRKMAKDAKDLLDRQYGNYLDPEMLRQLANQKLYIDSLIPAELGM